MDKLKASENRINNVKDPEAKKLLIDFSECMSLIYDAIFKLNDKCNKQNIDLITTHKQDPKSSSNADGEYEIKDQIKTELNGNTTTVKLGPFNVDYGLDVTDYNQVRKVSRYGH